VSNLAPFRYLDMVGEFAERFAQHPDKVFSTTDYDTVFNFSVSLYRRGYYTDIRNEVERLQTAPPTST